MCGNVTQVKRILEMKILESVSENVALFEQKTGFHVFSVDVVFADKTNVMDDAQRFTVVDVRIRAEV